MASQRIDANSLDDSPVVLLIGRRCWLAVAHVINTTAAIAHVQFFDVAAAASVTLGTTVPAYVLAVPASTSATQAFDELPQFDNGIAVASTTTATGSTAAITHLRVWVT